MDTTPFYVFLFLHLVSLIVGFGAVVVIDTAGILWVLKKIQLGFLRRLAQITQKLIWYGWGGLVLSGLGLIYLKGYVDNLTIIKLFFVAMLGANGVFLHFVKRSLQRIRETDVIPPLYQFRIILAACVSQIGWWGAILIGFLHRHVAHNIPWPQNPWAFISSFLFLVVLVLGAGEYLFKGRTKK